MIEVRIERRREGKEPRLAANLIVSQFVLPPATALKLATGLNRHASTKCRNSAAS